MGISPEDRVLRLLTIWSWVPAMGFLLPHGIITHNVVPALALIPMTMSLLCGLVHLFKCAGHPSASFAFTDVFVACFLVATGTPGLVKIKHDDYRWTAWSQYDRYALVMVGTYGTVPLMLNLYAFYASSFVLHHKQLLKLESKAAYIPILACDTSGEGLDLRSSSKLCSAARELSIQLARIASTNSFAVGN